MNIIALVLVCLTAVSGLLVALDKWVFAPRRYAARVAAEAQSDSKSGAEAKIPFWAETAHSFFPVLLFVLVVRSFVAEPFRIPSGSMLPTLHIGDFILVNKFSYGLRWPLGNGKFLEIGEPERGDVVVFMYPYDTSVDYIKRVVGVPGDRIEYKNKMFYLNGEPAAQSPFDGENLYLPNEHRVEQLGDVEHDILVNPRTVGLIPSQTPMIDGTGYVVPEGHYFVMGDNRDNSNDSRAWGLVPEANLRGKAWLIWLNLNLKDFSFDYRRIGTLID
ncbi:MAG: signal peptidase I [Gammaproteobacteria bacterium]|nr:signal peptidase I [Gammaproteobacteria bacterium]